MSSRFNVFGRHKVICVALTLSSFAYAQELTTDTQVLYLSRFAERVSNTSLQVPGLSFELHSNSAAESHVIHPSKVLLSTRVLLEAQTESELAGLLCHQVGHLRIGSQTAVSGPAVERQADLWGVRCMLALGLDPRGLISLGDTLQAAENRQTGSLDAGLMPHLPSDRRAEFEAAILSTPSYLLSEKYVVDTYHYHLQIVKRDELPNELIDSKLSKARQTMPEVTREDVVRALAGKEWVQYRIGDQRSYEVKDPEAVAHIEAKSIPALRPPSQTQTAMQPEATRKLGNAVLPKDATGAKLLLEDATPIKLRLLENISSATARTGDTIPFEVLEEVRVGDTVVIPIGSPAWATVTEAEHKKRMGRAGKLSVSLDSVRLVTGQKVALRSIQGGTGGGHVGAMTGAIVATAIVFWPAAPLFLFMSGKDKTIPKGTTINAYINGNIPLDWSALHPDVVNEAPRVQQLPTSNVDVKVQSTPENAEIELDGGFVGSTPSTLSLPPGEYALVITRRGYRQWSKRIRVVSGSIQITADLELLPN